MKSRVEKLIGWLAGLLRSYVILPVYCILSIPISDASFFQRKIPLRFRREYSQNGEDGIIHAIFSKIGTTNKFFVEFGVEDGMECNARYLEKKGNWHGLMMDGNPGSQSSVKKEYITAENIEALFAKYRVPAEFDLLSIDIDGNDYWVWKAVRNFRPRVVIVEYNAHIPPGEARTIPYQADFVWDSTDYYGASLALLAKLGREKGYTLICTDKNGVNAFFVRDDLVRKNFIARPLAEIYRPPAFKGKKGKGHPPDRKNRPWVTIP